MQGLASGDTIALVTTFVCVAIFCVSLISAHLLRSDLNPIKLPLSAYFEGASRPYALAGYAALCAAIAAHAFRVFTSGMNSGIAYGNWTLGTLYLVAVVATALSALSARVSTSPGKPRFLQFASLHRFVAQAAFITMIAAMFIETWTLRNHLFTVDFVSFLTLVLLAATMFVFAAYITIEFKGAAQKGAVLTILTWLCASAIMQ